MYKVHATARKDNHISDIQRTFSTYEEAMRYAYSKAYKQQAAQVDAGRVEVQTPGSARWMQVDPFLRNSLV